MKLTVLRNIGKKDAHLVGDNDLADFREGAEVDVNDKVAQRLMDAKLAEPASKTLNAVPPKSDVTTGGEDTSEVANLTVPEATDKISRMRKESTDKLEHIAATDTRKAVKDAAAKRLEELK